MIHNQWSQGQLFAFSGLDGENLMTTDVPGILCGDKIGVRFYANPVRELAMMRPEYVKPLADAVGGDFFTMPTEAGTVMMVLLNNRLVAGQTVNGGHISLLVEGPAEYSKLGEAEIQTAGEGNVSAFLRRGDRFALAFGKTAEEAAALAEEGMKADLEAVVADRKAWLASHSLPDSHPYAALYAKCVATMKTQIYTPEGQIRHRYSTPDRLPHHKMWFWDSIFHAIGWRNLDAALAEEMTLAMIDVQTEEGMFPLDATPHTTSETTQPPVLAWGALKVFEKSGNKEFLRAVLEANLRYLDWLDANRRDTEAPLYTWLTEENINCRCGESGMDNSPRFDIHHRLFAIDLSCFVANEQRLTAKIAEILGEAETAAALSARFEATKKAINEVLWDEEDGFYYDWDQSTKAHQKVRAVSSFLPLFAGICDEKQAQALVACLNDPQDFQATFPIPSISKKDATYGSDMWRGPVWINYNYMIAEGLEAYGFAPLADHIRTRTVEVLDEWFKVYSTLFEFYDCEDVTPPARLYRKGPAIEPYNFRNRPQAIRDYGWSNTLLLDLLSK